MVYRHFPKLENRDFSILTLALTGTTDRNKAKALLKAAAQCGINLVWTGSSPETVTLVAHTLAETGLRQSFSLITGFDLRELTNASETGNHEKIAEEFQAQLNRAESGPDDFLVFMIDDARSCEIYAKAGLFRAAASAKAGGRLAAAGFWAPPYQTVIIPTLGAWEGWDFFSTDCNYLLQENKAANIGRAIACAADSEIGLIATNPFAGGCLEAVSPAVHEIFRHAPVPRAPDEWALRAVWELQETVSIAWEPSGEEELKRKAILAEAGRANSLPSAELQVLKDAARKLAE